MGFTFVQAQSTAQGPSYPWSTVSYPSNTTAGSLLIAGGRFSSGSPGNIPTISDTQGNTWVLLQSAVLGGDTRFVLWYCASCVGGPNTVTFTQTSGQYIHANLLEYSYTGGTIGVDQQQTGTGTGSALVTPTITTVADGDLIYAHWANGTANGTATVGGSFTIRSSSAGDAFVADEVQGTHGSVSATLTFSSPVTYIAGIVAFKLVGAAPPPRKSTVVFFMY
jgi:hypothetical protein